MKKLFTLFLLAFLPLLASADPVEIDGLYYNLISKDKAAVVTSNPSGTKYSGEIVIPNTVTCEGDIYDVTIIGEKAFYFCSNLTSVSIPNSVLIIEDEAFEGCSELSSVPIPNSVTSIGDYAFYYCSGLTSVTIPNSVTSIGDYAFYYCSGLTSITIPNSVTSIEGYAFSYCSGLTSITIPSSVKEIEGCVFSGCSGLTSIIVEDGNTVYDSRNNCNAIIVTASDSLVVGCNNTIVPNSVTAICSNAFVDCSEIKIEEGHPKYDSRNNCNAVIETASNTLIAGCVNTTIPNSVTSIGGGAFSRCSGLTSITIPNNVKEIGFGAFSFCSGLTSVTIPNSVTSIGSSAFSYCTGLTSVTLGKAVGNIGNRAFGYNIRFTDIYCYAEKCPYIDIYAFYETQGDTFEHQITWHVPKSNIDTYNNKLKGAGYKAIVPLEEYTLTYKVDGEVYKTYQEAEGAPLSPEPEPTKEGYTFSGWSYIPAVMPAEDVTIMGSFTMDSTEDEIKITSAGQTTWCSAYDLDFTDVEGLKAYTATGYDRETGIIWLTRIYKIPAGEGILLIGDAGEYKIPHKSTSAYYANLMVGTLKAITLNETDGEYTNYYLSDGSFGVGFYRVNGSVDLKANRAYLPLLKSTTSGSRGFIGLDFDDGEEGTTGISGAPQRVGETDVYYNLQGQRVDNPSKGLYIKNGKKIVIK